MSASGFPLRWLAGWRQSFFSKHQALQLASQFAVLATFVLVYAATWFVFNLGRMPPYIPGATTDPTFASPQAVKALAVFTSALVLPGSALACALAFRLRKRMTKTNA